MAVVSRDSKRWQAEDDARTLANAQEILQSAKRKSAAVRAAKKLAQDAQKQAKTYNRVSKRKK